MSVRRRLLPRLLHWHSYGVEDAVIGVVLHEGDDGEVLEGDLGKPVGECTFLAVKAQVVLDVPLQIGEVDRDPELTRPGGEISAFKTAREIADNVVVVTELVDANVTDGLLGERQPQPGTRPALSFARVVGVSIGILCRGRLIGVGDSLSGHGCLGRDLDLVSGPRGRHMDRRLPGRFQLRVDDSPILLVFLFREQHRAPASSVGMTIEENGWSTTYLVAVVLLAGLAVLVCQRVGAGDVQVVLQADQFGRLVGLEQGVEGDIRRHTGRALRSGEQLHQNDVVGLGIFSTGVLLRREGRNLLAVFLVEPALQPGGTRLGGASDVSFAGKLGGPGQDCNHGGLLLQALLFVDLLVGLLGQFEGELGVGPGGAQCLERPLADLADPGLAVGLCVLEQGLDRCIDLIRGKPARLGGCQQLSVEEIIRWVALVLPGRVPELLDLGFWVPLSYSGEVLLDDRTWLELRDSLTLGPFQSCRINFAAERKAAQDLTCLRAPLASVPWNLFRPAAPLRAITRASPWIATCSTFASPSIIFWMFTTDAAGFPSFASTLMMANSSSPRARTINFQVPANLSVGSPTIAAESAKSGIPARASTITIARKDREASLMSLVPGTALRRRGSRRR